MTAPTQLANRLREVILNGTWIANTNYKQELVHLDWEIATTKIKEINTVSVLAQHIHYYIKGINNVFINGQLEIRDKYSFDFPEIQSESNWKQFLNTFWKDTEQLATFIEQLSEEQLHQDFVNKKYGTYLRNINGMIEHCYYHLGQIILIKKMLTTSNFTTNKQEM